MKQAVERRKIVAIDVKQVICLTGHRPGAGDLGAGVDHSGKAGRLFGAMGAQVYLNKALNLQTQLKRVQPRGVSGDVSFGLKPLTAAACLAGGQVQQLSQLMRCQVCILLKS